MNIQSIYNALCGDRIQEARIELLFFLKKQFGLQASSLEFQQSAVSLNSFKGVFKSNGQRYFFKTHIESMGEVSEYRGARLLAEAGYPMIEPLFACRERGRELLVYPFIEDPSLFEVVRDGRIPEGFKTAQNGLDRKIFEIYRKTFCEKIPSKFPDVQQLFYRRLIGARFNDFYRGRSRMLGGRSVTFEQIECAEWRVNGRAMGKMSDWFAMAESLLSPENTLPFTVIGHGDAHNGNVFYGKDGLRLFDPAYAGKMDPFLDMTKPLFHNTFARWMYFPKEVSAQINLEVRWDKGRVEIWHDFESNEIERFFFDSKIESILVPLVQFLEARAVLPLDWEARLRSSLLCCPLLTVNLFDEKKFDSSVSILGFAMVAEMANFNFGTLLTTSSP